MSGSFRLAPRLRAGGTAAQGVPRGAAAVALQLTVASLSRWHPGPPRPPPRAPHSLAAQHCCPAREALQWSGGWHSGSWAVCPCAVPSSPGRTCAPLPGLQDTSPPSPPGWGLELQDCVHDDSRAQQGCCCSAPLRNVRGSCAASRGSLSLREAVAVMVPRWKAPSPEGRARCMCLKAKQYSFLPSPRAGAWRPKIGVHLINGVLFV